MALLDGPIDGAHPYLHDLAPGWNAINGKPQSRRPDPRGRRARAPRWPGIVAGAAARRACTASRPRPSLVPIQVLEMQQGALMGTTATLLAGLDRALDPNGDGNLSDHANVILAPLAEPFAAFGASAETVAAEGVERAGAVLVAAAGNDGATGGRFGTIASPAASPGWLAVGASDGRSVAADASTWRSARTASRRASTTCRCWARCRPRATRRCRSCSRPAPRSPTPRARRPTSSPGTDEGDFRATDGTSLVSGKAVLLPRDGAPIAQRAAAAGAAGAIALVLYGDGSAPAGALGLDDRVKLPIAVLPGDQGATAAATLLTGGAVTITFSTTSTDDNPEAGGGGRLLLDRPGLRRLDQARPRRAGRGGHDLRAGRPATWPRAARPWRPRRSRASRRSCSRRIRPGRRGSCAARSSGRPRPSAATGDGPRAVEAQGGGAVSPAGAVAASVVAEPSSLTFGLARAASVKVSRVLTLANTGSSTVHVSLALSRDRVDDGDASVALTGAPSSLAIAPGGDACRCR